MVVPEITPIENEKNTFATKENIVLLKEDILNLKIGMEHGFRNNLKWVVTAIINCTIILAAAIKFMH